MFLLILFIGKKLLKFFFFNICLGVECLLIFLYVVKLFKLELMLVLLVFGFFFLCWILMYFLLLK